jgi:UDP-2,3-diacylglucosamine hydrolase
MENFEDIVKKRVSFYETELIIEGHFHQGNEYKIDGKRYVNVPSLSCCKTYFVLKNGCFIGEKVDDDI